MKKQLTILAVLLWAVLGLKAQQNGIIYTDFNPDLCVEELSPYDSHDTLKIDLDHDGTMDFKMYIESKYSTMVRHVYVTSSWDFRYCYNSIYSYGYMDENDTIIPNHSIWAPANSTWELLWSDYGPYMEFIMGFRKTVDEDNYYAWAKIYMYRNVNGNGYAPGPGEFDIVSAYCDDMAFCTVPDYPLMWGQTEIENYILYTDFEPDLCVSSLDYPNCFYDTIKIDFDQNGITDFKMYLSWRSTGEIAIDMLSSWELRFKLSDNDSIVPSEEGWHIANYPIQYLFMDTTHLEDMIGFRTIINGDYYYAWSKVYADIQHTSTHDKVWANVDRIAFCTIPNYPLRWGQTSLDSIGVDGAEWYYEILNDNGTITYQYLQCAGDTTINEQRPKVIVRSNTQYDRGETTVVTHEYIYEENGIVYWWNKTLEEFTVLYNLNANTGDEWEIKVGMESIVMHVDAVESIVYEGRVYRMLHVSDENDIFSGDIVCGIGHLTSFFPEKLMNRGKGYRVEGMRCYWVDGDLVFKYGDRDCDEVYEQLHYGIDEPGENGPSTGSGTLMVYPNPTNDILFVETRLIASLPAETYHITNLVGQTVLSGHITAETQQINIENLPAGMYFITYAGETRKFVVK